MIPTVFTRIGSKWSVLRKWDLDDTIILITMVCLNLSFGRRQTDVDYSYLQLATPSRFRGWCPMVWANLSLHLIVRHLSHLNE
jgi:hypothetical protein